MGPAILIDKSTFQSLSKDEVFYLQIHYNVVYCPTIFYEILGDLTKHKDIESSRKEVAKLSYKINGLDTCFTTDFRTLLTAELFGHNITMDGRPILSGGKEVVDAEGNRGMFFDESPEYVALRKWTDGEFTEAEKQHSENWRNSIQDIDLDIAKANSKYIKVKKITDLKKCTHELLDDPDNQLFLLQFILSQTGLNSGYRNQICDQWLKNGMPNITEFAPYCYYFLTVSMAFYIGIANNLISNKATNLIDLEYIYYLPFCKLFSSTDKFLKTFSPLFIIEGQRFVWGNDLKSDLKSLCKYWEEKGSDARFAYQKEYGNYPPKIPNSLTCEIWEKWAGQRRKQKKFTNEEKEHIQDKLNSILMQIKKGKP